MEAITQCVIKVLQVVRPGFLKSVYRLDIGVEGRIIVELKQRLTKLEDESKPDYAQVRSYLKVALFRMADSCEFCESKEGFLSEAFFPDITRIRTIPILVVSR